MKATNSTPGTVIRTQSGSVTISPQPKATAPGLVSLIKQAINNYKSKTGKSSPLEQRIFFIDSKFHALPTTIKGAWDAAATSIPTAEICGCQHQGINGQKLYRSVNLYRSQTGLPDTNVPPDLSLWAQIFMEIFRRTPGPATPSSIVEIAVNSTLFDVGIQIRGTGGLTAPVLVQPMGITMLTLHPGDPGFDQLIVLEINKPYGYCLSMTNGAPITSDTFILQIA